MNENLESVKATRLNTHILNVFNAFFPSKKIIYDFTHQEAGVDFSFESFNHGIQGYLTAQGGNIKPGVYISLCIEKILHEYEVREVSFYSSPENMWTAHLVKANKKKAIS
jgi:hypothetical protein